MYRGTVDYPRTAEFLKYAVSSCGIPVELHGKQEMVRENTDVSLELPQPFKSSAFCRAKIPPILARVTTLYLLDEDTLVTSMGIEEGSDRVFEAETVKSVHPSIKEGDTIIGMTGMGCVTLVLNTQDPEAMGHLLETYDDKHCMQHVLL